jgi:hypothetical protein
MQYQSGKHHSKKWYKRNIFPLVPIIEYRKADQYNTSNFCFRWLFFTVWTLDSFSFELSVVFTSHWGLGFIGIFPYIRWCVSIPCPSKLALWSSKHLNRKP